MSEFNIFRPLKGPGARTTNAAIIEKMSVLLRKHRKDERRANRENPLPPWERRYTREQWMLVPKRTKRRLLGTRGASVRVVLR